MTRLLDRALRVVALLAVALAASWLWGAHRTAWNTGPPRPQLGYDASQYAIAARELAETGRLQTPFALPIELARHPSPPWPLAVVQPGLVLAEAALFRLVPEGSDMPGAATTGRTPAEREWLALLVPFVAFVTLALGLAATAMSMVARIAPGRMLLAPAAGVVVALGFALDPEAQHFASGGFTEVPFTLGLFLALVHLITGGASRRPLIFGFLLGVTGLFRANMLWLAPLLAWAAAWAFTDDARALGRPSTLGRSRWVVFALILVGYAVPLIPWWFYKWQAFGSPAWDITRYTLWDGIGGHSWFSLYHLPELPSVPAGLAALGAVAGKVLNNLPGLLLEAFTGPRALWIGALVTWLIVNRRGHDDPLRSTARRRALRAAVVVVLGAMALNMLAAAATIPWIRFLFPSRVLIEAAGVLALWDLARRLPTETVGVFGRRAIAVGTAALVLGWGASQTAAGIREARDTSINRAIPSLRTLGELVELIDTELAPGEPVMSNLGPMLAWATRRPVVHLALTPGDVASCRRRVDTRHVILAFRGPDRAWPAWQEVVANPEAAPRNPEWNVRWVREFKSDDGFTIVWLEMGPLGPALAGISPAADVGADPVR